MAQTQTSNLPTQFGNVKVSMIYVIRLDKTLNRTPTWYGTRNLYSTDYNRVEPMPRQDVKNIARGQSLAGEISARSHNNIIVGNIL